MKKIILFIAILFATTSIINAQTAETTETESESVTEAKTELSVTLHPIQIITINDVGVDLAYITKDHYSDGVTTKKDKHLSIYSTGGFVVNVKSASDNLIGVGNDAKTIPSNTISLAASNTKVPTLSPISVALSSKDSPLFSSVKGGSDLSYNVNYKGADLNGYFDKLFNKTEPSVFKTEVTYTITPL